MLGEVLPLRMFLLFAIFFVHGLAQRPANISTCDYYAQALYGSSTNATQFHLVTDLVALAFGGNCGITNLSAVTGILNPGIFFYNGQNMTVDLRPWFDGSIASTNLNDAAVGVNWLDGGGLDPLCNYLNGTTSSIVITPNTTNQYRLFSHFLPSFAGLFGCSQPPYSPPSTGPALSLAYVHKFMNLNYTDIGHFIDQLTKTTEHWGFSQEDSQTLSTSLYSLYNVRCAPPITLDPNEGPELLSLCQNPTCPLAVPNADCAAYVNLTADGIQSSPPSSMTSMPATVTLTSTLSMDMSGYTMIGTSMVSMPTGGAVTSSSSSSLSGGDIAGIVIGGVAVLIILAGLIIWSFKKRKPVEIPYRTQPAFSNMPMAGGVQDKHISYSESGGDQPISELGSPRVGPELGSPRVGSPEMSMRQPVELGGGPDRRSQFWIRSQ